MMPLIKIKKKKKKELTGNHIEIVLFIEIETLELTSGHIDIMLFVEIETQEFDFTAAILK